MAKKYSLFIILGVIVAVFIWVGTSYNAIVKAGLDVDTKWAQVESQYQRRIDLIPNLVASVQGIMKQEKDVFSALADARSHYAGATNTDAKAKAAGEVEGALSRLLVISENYPQLKSSENVSSLMAELAGTENRVAVERMRFNESVTSYNTLVVTFPGTIIASIFHFQKRNFFEAEKGAEKAPVVNLK
jgi:LemA protein